MAMRQLRIGEFPAAKDLTVMRQLRIRELPAVTDKLANTFITALAVLALFWGYQLRQAVDERDYLIRTIAFEASGETEVGKIAVAYVVLNRKKRRRWGDTIKSVVTFPGQFEPWMTRRKAIQTLSRNDPRYKRAIKIADAVLGGQILDPTAGATHFLNPTIVRARRGGLLPSWAQGEGRTTAGILSILRMRNPSKPTHLALKFKLAKLTAYCRRRRVTDLQPPAPVSVLR